MSDAAASATIESKPRIWREIRARLCMQPAEPHWLATGNRRHQRRLCRLLIAELLRDQRTTS